MTGPVRERPLAVDDEDFGELLRISLREGGAVWIRASGNSMAPTIPNDALVRQHAVSDGLRVGDVVLVRSQVRGHALHRVTEIRGPHVRTVGDNRIDPDQLTPIADVVAAADAVQIGGVTRALRVGRLGTFRCQLRRLRRRVLRKIWALLRRFGSRNREASYRGGTQA